MLLIETATAIDHGLVAFEQEAADIPLFGTGKQNNPMLMFSKPILVDDWLSLYVTTQISLGDQLNQILLTLIIHGQTGQTEEFLPQLTTTNPEIDSNDGLHAFAMSLTVKTHQTALVHLIGNGHSRHTKLGSTTYQWLNLLKTIHHRKIGVHTKMNETGFSHGYLWSRSSYSSPRLRRTGRKLRR